MATVEEFLDALRSEVGYTENPPGSNRTKFAAEAGHANGYRWCATFLVAIAKRVGLELPPGADTAYTPSMRAAFQRAGRWSSIPKVGSFGFIDRPDIPMRHVLVVEQVPLAPSYSTVITLEGNTSSGNAGSQDNGGGVFRRVRPLSLFLGFGHPNFSTEDYVATLDPEDRMLIVDAVADEVMKRLADDQNVVAANRLRKAAAKADEAVRLLTSSR